MAKIPTKPEEIFDEFTADYKKVFGADLVSILLHGSGARGEYIQKKSDINFIVVLTEAGMNGLAGALPLVTKWKKRAVHTPLFLTKGYIDSSLDVFPIEFLNVTTAYKVVYGEDPVQNIVFDNRLLRIQCERELKGKLLQLRQNFLETDGDRKKIESLIAISLPTFFSLFRAFLVLKGRKPVPGKAALIENMSLEAGLDKEFFLKLLAIREGREKLSSPDALSCMAHYIDEAKKLSIIIDQLETQQGGKQQ